MDTRSVESAIWEEWSRVTRFLKSTRIAFARERLLLESLQLSDKADAKLSVPTDRSLYTVTFAQHLTAMEDESTLYAAVLIQSYALTEAAAADRLGSPVAGGIEDWGVHLLAKNDQKWTDVMDGRAGAAEVGVIRNAFAHGTRRVDGSGANRLRGAGAPLREEGSVVTITYADVETYRARLRSLLRFSGFRSVSE